MLHEEQGRVDAQLASLRAMSSWRSDRETRRRETEDKSICRGPVGKLFGHFEPLHFPEYINRKLLIGLSPYPELAYSCQVQDNRRTPMRCHHSCWVPWSYASSAVSNFLNLESIQIAYGNHLFPIGCCSAPP